MDLLLGDGARRFLEILLGGAPPEDLLLKLYTNNRTPAVKDRASDFLEATFTGYAPAPLTRGRWGEVTGNPAVTTYPAQTFRSTATQAAQKVYGYYVVGAASGLAYWAGRFTDGPYQVGFEGDEVTVTPRFQQGQQR